MIRKLLSLFGGKSRPQIPFHPASGQLLSVRTDDGRYGVVKLLVVDDEGVHIRLYVQRFAARPGEGDLGELTVAGFGPGHDHPFSIGHMPISHESFAGWEPLLASEQPVTEDELIGYRTWKEANGGYF